MSGRYSHSWDVAPREAGEIQQRLSQSVIKTDQLGPVRFVAGVDVGFTDNNTVTRAAVAVLSYPDLRLCDQAVASRPTTFPYVPGLLSFREAPAVLEALQQLKIRPDLLLCDGQGLAHPRRFGLACHIGLLSDLPSIGVAKRRLVGRHDEVPQTRGAWRPLQYQDDIVGAVLRSRANVKPIYISIGHRISLETAVAYVMDFTPKYRLPETTRLAHRLASGEKL